jgi:quercetin dioxygenase-like cupin family protein
VSAIESQVRRAGDAVSETTEWGSVTWLARGTSPAGLESSLAIADFAAGEGNAEHAHPDCEEIVYVLEGAVEHTLGDEVTMLQAGDLIVVPRDTAHRIRGGANGARALIVFSSPERTFVATGR